MLDLRSWQEECVSRAVKNYRAGHKHFLVAATPGAGKTVMASTVAKRLFDTKKIDFVLCFAPSVAVIRSFGDQLATVTGLPMSGRLGASGEVLTYQALTNLPANFWEGLSRHRVFIILDEIHHCGGHAANSANAWGRAVLEKVLDVATYTLALSGTPWRSDALPVALAQYCENTGKLACDYIYSLTRAIAEGVCRIPQITAVDNNRILVETHNGNQSEYSGIAEVLNSRHVSFENLLNSRFLIDHLLTLSVTKLKELRVGTPDAGGLIVASSIAHAVHISEVLQRRYGQSVCLVTSQDPDAQAHLNQYRQSKTQWIVSVGMVSEGTDIPRLQVCCHLSRIKTELHFRQVLGRVIRTTTNSSGFAYLLIPAEASLVEYARRVQDDLPGEVGVFNQEQINDTFESLSDLSSNAENQNSVPSGGAHPAEPQPLATIFTEGEAHSPFATHLRLTGKFFQEMISLQAAFND